MLLSSCTSTIACVVLFTGAFRHGFQGVVVNSFDIAMVPCVVMPLKDSKCSLAVLQHLPHLRSILDTGTACNIELLVNKCDHRPRRRCQIFLEPDKFLGWNIAIRPVELSVIVIDPLDVEVCVEDDEVNPFRIKRLVAGSLWGSRVFNTGQELLFRYAVYIVVPQHVIARPFELPVDFLNST